VGYKLEKTLITYQTMTKEQSPQDRLLLAQKEIGAIKKDKENPFFSSKYVDINGLLAVVKPVLNKHGLVVSQPMTLVEGKVALSTRILDVATNEIVLESCVLLPTDLDSQKMGSAITYYRRYSLQSLLALEAEDDDGNKAVEGNNALQHKNAKAWKKSVDNDTTCPVCGGVEKRSFGVSKAGKEFNMLQCQEDNKHVTWLDVDPIEMGDELRKRK
jgi:hypothetical protein